VNRASFSFRFTKPCCTEVCFLLKKFLKVHYKIVLHVSNKNIKQCFCFICTFHSHVNTLIECNQIIAHCRFSCGNCCRQLGILLNGRLRALQSIVTESFCIRRRKKRFENGVVTVDVLTAHFYQKTASNEMARPIVDYAHRSHVDRSTAMPSTHTTAACFIPCAAENMNEGIRKREIFITDVHLEIVESGHGRHEGVCRTPCRSMATCTEHECALKARKKKFSLPMCTGRSSRTVTTFTVATKAALRPRRAGNTIAIGTIVPIVCTVRRQKSAQNMNGYSMREKQI
jgi:hypothetical protein